MPEEIEEDVDFEEYRLPELDYSKDKKAEKKKQAESVSEKVIDKSASVERNEPSHEELGLSAESGSESEFVVREDSTVKKPSGLQADDDAMSLNEHDLAELLDSKSKEVRKEKHEAMPKLPGISKGTARVSSGVLGFDDLVEGGFPVNSLILVRGCAGAGKTIFGMNFLMEGIEKGETGCYFSLEEPVSELARQMNCFGWDIMKLEREGKLSLKQPELYEFDSLLTLVEETVKSSKARRIVFDSISVLGLYFQDQFKFRRALVGFERMLKRLGCTAIILSEANAEEGVSGGAIEEFVADGVLGLGLVERDGIFHRVLSILKLRATNHSLKLHPFAVQEGAGIVVFPNEKAFSRF